jgi:hypothetical protein
MTGFDSMTTDELMQHVRLDSAASERELALLDRLVGAIDEIDTLTRDVVRLQAATEPQAA